MRKLPETFVSLEQELSETDVPFEQFRATTWNLVTLLKTDLDRANLAHLSVHIFSCSAERLISLVSLIDAETFLKQKRGLGNLSIQETPSPP